MQLVLLNPILMIFRKIIQDKLKLFRSRDTTEKIIIGRSLIPVDYSYFEEIIRNISDDVAWYFLWYSLDDLKRTNEFANHFNINNHNIFLFLVTKIIVLN